MRRKIYVMLAPHEAGALLDLSLREDRYPQQQAARFIREGLARAGALPAEQAESDHRAETAAALVAAN